MSEDKSKDGTFFPSRVSFTFESIYKGEDGKLYYEKSKGVKESSISFYLRFAHKSWVPCKDCQHELMKTIMGADSWTFGNKDYEPQIELNKRSDEIDDSAWVTIEKREVTEKEAKKLADGGVFWSG